MILEINGKAVEQMEMTDAVKEMRGPAGEEVNLALAADGDERGPEADHCPRGD